MKRIFVFFVYAFFLCNIIYSEFIVSKTYLDADPKSNMTETYVQLKEVSTIGPEITPEVFIYKPVSLTFDNEGNLYVFDRGQHKIIQLDKKLKFVRMIGRDGQGPGEFLKNPNSPVYIHVGPDKKLYCNDVSALKIIVFDLKGNYITDYQTPEMLFGKPVVDGKGQLYFFSGNDREIKAKSQEGETIFKISVKAKDVYSVLFSSRNLDQHDYRVFFKSSFLDPGRLSLYFSNSSTMLNVSGGKIVGNYRILPKDRLAEYKKDIKKFSKEKKFIIPFFDRIVPDGDLSGVYYLSQTRNKMTNRSLLYQMSLNGELKKTLYIDYDKTPGAILIWAKKNNFFYAKKTREEVIEIYKEEE